MNFHKMLIVSYSIGYMLFSNCHGFELITTVLSGALAGTGVYKVVEYFSRCTPRVLDKQASIMVDKFRRNLIGQHIVYHHVLATVKAHISDDDPSHALSLVFSGTTGTGKNYAAQLIAESIYNEGLKSKFVHLFSGRFHFPLESKSYQYQADLQTWIKGNVTVCPHSIFIFDEIDKMPAKILDSIKPFLEYSAVYQGVSFKQAIFIFLTNLGGLQINKIYRQLRESGVVREEMNYADFESDLRQILFDSREGMFQDSDAIKNHVISQYLPFLPLEKTHVKSCIEKEMSRKNINPTPARIESILKYIDFHNDLWSLSGCKRISDHVSAHIGKWSN